MPTVTFVLYKNFPISCEGNDVPGEAKALKIWMRDSPHLRDEAEKLAMELSLEHKKHTQLWEIG